MSKINGFQLFEAVRKNVSAPDEAEEKAFTVSKMLRASTNREGDSEMGLILFVGVGKEYGMSDDDIMNSVSLEPSELAWKHGRYQSMEKTSIRFRNKIKLIKNYLRLVYGVQ